MVVVRAPAGPEWAVALVCGLVAACSPFDRKDAGCQGDADCFANERCDLLASPPACVAVPTVGGEGEGEGSAEGEGEGSAEGEGEGPSEGEGEGSAEGEGEGPPPAAPPPTFVSAGQAVPATVVASSRHRAVIGGVPSVAPAWARSAAHRLILELPVPAEVPR